MALEQAGVQLIAQGANVYISDLNSATKATSSFVDTADRGGGKVNAAGQVMIGALRKVGEIAVDALGDAAKATASFLKDSIGIAGDFEAGMNDFRAVAGKDVDAKGLEQFRDLFIDIGKRLPVSTSEVQDAAIEMIKGGIDPATVAAGGLEQNIKFAAAAMDGDLAEAANVSAKILGGWADINATAAQKADFLTHSTDLLTKAANASSVDVHELSLGIFNAQGIAKTAGVSFDDLTTTLAALAPRFASSSEAGNSLKNVIARLQPTTDPAYQAMADLGLITEDGANKFYDAQGKFVGFEKASQLLQDSLVGLTQQQKQAVLQTIFGNDAMNAAAALADLGAAGYTKMADALDKANGVQENAALKQQGFNTALDNAKGSVEALQITIGSALLPVLTDLLNNVVAPAVNTFTDLADAVFGSDEAFNRLSPDLQALVTVIDAVSEGFSDNGLLGALDQLFPGMSTTIHSFDQAANAGDELSGVIEDLNGIWQKALGVVTDVGNGYLAIAQSILPIVTQFWSDHGTEITTFLQTAYTKIMSIVNLALDLYDAIVPKVLGNVAQWIEDHATGIQAVLSGAWQAINGIIDGALTLIEGTFKIALDLINGDWKKAWEDLKSMSATFVLDLERAIEGFLNIIAGFFNTNLQEIADLWAHNWDAIYNYVMNIDWLDVGASIIAGIIQGVSGNAGRLFDEIKGVALGALKAAQDLLRIGSPSQAMADGVGLPIVQGIVQGITNATPSLINSVSIIAGQITGTFTDTDIVSALQELGADAMAGFGKGIKSSLRSITNLIESTANTVEDAFRDAFGAHSPAERMVPVGQSVIEGIMQGLTDTWPALTDLVSTLSDDLISQAADLGSSIQDALASGFSGTASLDRQIAANLDKVGKIEDAFTRQFLTYQLRDQQKIAESFADPAAGAKYFKMASSNIFELNDLRDKLNAAQDEAERDRIKQQIKLIESAQGAEMQAFQSQNGPNANPYQDLVSQVSSLLSQIPVNDTGVGHDLNTLFDQLLMQLGLIPRRASGGAVQTGQPYWVGEHGKELFWPQMNGMISPAASSAQMAARASTTNYTTNNSYTMPVYTNNTPGAIQQSWAIVQASMP